MRVAGILGIGAAFVALSAIGCSRSGSTRSDPSGATPGEVALPEDASGIGTDVARLASVADYLDVNGQIEADPARVVRVYAPVSGRLVAVSVHPADSVHEGQSLATLVSSDVAAARATYRQAQADARVKRQALDRSRLLFQNDAIPLRDYQQAQADDVTGAANFESAQERMQLLGVDTAGTSDVIAVAAPRSGVVLDVGAAPGEYVKSLDNATPLCTVADLSTVWAVGDVYENAVAGIRMGDPVEVSAPAYSGAHWEARVATVGDVVDTLSRTLKIRIVLRNEDGRLKPAMFVTIRVVRGRRVAVVVPRRAVLVAGTSAYVFVQKSPGHFERRDIVLGADAGDRVEVTAGLAAGDTIAVEGAELLRATAASS
ncbi:MAG TPA: efflux RND transporter periplasmic adaptor subunit [Gemmatimonadales bacterium]|nr:efflux RND transporter periplasmic adaptor subunit [Gemmatimonadales bacterium]